MNEVPEEIAQAINDNMQAIERNEEAAFQVLNVLTEEQRERVIWFMEDMNAIHDMFFLLRLSAAKAFALDAVGERHGIACVIDGRVMEITARLRERTEDDPEPVIVGKAASA